MTAGVKLTQNEVAAYFKERGCELLGEYENARAKVRYRCSCGDESEIRFYNFKLGNRCNKCGSRQSGDKQRLSHAEVAAHFAEQGCELLDEYKGNLLPMKYRCSCGNESKINWNNFKSKGRRCKECGVRKRSGEKHYEWRSDREQVDAEYMFRQRCYKLVKMVLNVTGRVKNEKTAKILGYDYKQLQEHVAAHPNWVLVKDGDWHIDHIFPIKAFLDYGVTDLKIINSLDNLRPLTAQENLSKNAKYDAKAFEIYLRSKGVNV